MTIDTNDMYEEASFPFYHSFAGLGVSTTDTFFKDLENVLRKHFGDDWSWDYKDGYHPLTIYSGKLGEMWEAEMEDEDD